MTNTNFWDLDEKDDWRTPPSLIEDLSNAVDGFDLDPCAAEDTTIGETNYTIEDDGLSQQWFGDVFVNPPFSYKSDWLEKAEEELERGDVDSIVFLTPDSTDTKSWWHRYIATNAKYICFCKGRLSYYDDDWEEKGSPTFGTAISTYGDVPLDLVGVLQDYGHVVKTVE